MKKLKRENSDERRVIFHCNIPRNDALLSDIVKDFQNLPGVDIKTVVTGTSDKDLNYMDVTVTLPDNDVYVQYMRSNHPLLQKATKVGHANGMNSERAVR